MEALFVKILNSTLLFFAFSCLLLAGGAVLILGFNVGTAFFANTSTENVSVEYQPANVVSAEGSGSLEATPSRHSEDSELLKAARESCNATNALIEFISKNQLGLANSDKCISDELNSIALQYSDRSQNYFTERVRYMKAVLADSQARAVFNIAPGADVNDETNKYVNDINSRFDDKFRAAATVDDARKAREFGASMQAKAATIVLASAAATAFFAFLIIAFLLVAVRLEKHVGSIEAKI